MGKEDRNCIPRHFVSLVKDFDCWNDYPWGEYMWVKFYKRTIWILESYPNSKKWWLKKDNMLSRALACSSVTKFGKNDYNGLFGPDSNPNLKLYATPVKQQTDWFKASIEYINGLVDLDMNVSEDDIGGDISNNSLDLNDNAISGNGNNDVLLLEGGDGFVDSVGGDKNHECNQDKPDKQDQHPSLPDVLHELRTLRKEVALFKSTCSRHVVDNPARNNDSRNSNHNVVYTRLSCSANDHMSSCLSPEMPNDEVAVAALQFIMKMRCMIAQNLNTSCPEMYNAEVLVAGIGIDKADENIYNSNANDNDVNQGITSNSSGREMPNAWLWLLVWELTSQMGIMITQTPMIMMSTKELTPCSFSMLMIEDLNL
nr:hypothetical protein [Tanacetum cinerariifolium]